MYNWDMKIGNKVENWTPMLLPYCLERASQLIVVKKDIDNDNYAFSNRKHSIERPLTHLIRDIKDKDTAISKTP